MAAHNYDGDMLTDEVAQVHRSPGFITSNLIGKNDDGTLIKGTYGGVCGSSGGGGVESVCGEMCSAKTSSLSVGVYMRNSYVFTLCFEEHWVLWLFWHSSHIPD